MTSDPDNQGLNPELFITRVEFHKYVISNRDRQDDNKTEILDAIEKVVDNVKADLGDDIEDLETSVENLEADARKQNIIAAAIAGGVSVISAAITAAVLYIKGV